MDLVSIIWSPKISSFGEIGQKLTYEAEFLPLDSSQRAGKDGAGFDNQLYVAAKRGTT